MFGRKLLTLACAVGILAFGACFGTLDRPSPPPPLAPRLDLHGIKSIEVVVKNVSESHHLDPSDLAQTVAKRINWRTEQTGVTADVPQEGRAGEGVLEIKVLRESATPIPPPSASRVQWWSIMVNTSATLTKADGHVIWRETNFSNQLSSGFTAKDVEQLWKKPALRDWLPIELSNRLVYRMFYAK